MDWETKVFIVNFVPYLKLARIGRGGSSKVYRVMHPDGNIFAIKHVELENVDTSTRDSHVGEINLLSQLQKYECIIKMYDWEMFDKSLNIVLELGEVDLASLLAQKGPLLYEHGENYLRFYWQQMLEAVNLIHKEGIVHSDLKPQNFVSVKCRLKLIDFGIAKAIQSQDTTNVHRDNVLGTLNYIAPEVLNNYQNGNTKYGRASDVWSLGCILYQMVYGKPPLHSYGNHMAIAVLNDPTFKFEFPKNPKTGQDIPQCVHNVLSLCLERDQDKRPTCASLLDHPFLHPTLGKQ